MRVSDDGRAELEEFRKLYSIPKFKDAVFEPGQVVKVVIGMDGGSTSSKAVLVDENKNILKKEYQLSKGNPIQDLKEILARLKAYVTDQGAKLEIMDAGHVPHEERPREFLAFLTEFLEGKRG